MSLLAVPTRRFKFWLRLSMAYLQRYQMRLAISLVTIIFLILATVSIWPKFSRTNIVAIGYIGSHTIETIPTEVLSLATQPLISNNEQGRPVPALASHWTVSDDGKTYIIFLKDNLKWHDETLVDTSNIAIAITNIEITALNNKAIEFKLPTSIASFPQALNKPVFKTKTFYGTGQYRIVKIDTVDDIVKKIVLHPKDTSLPQVKFKFYQPHFHQPIAFKMPKSKEVG